VGGPLAHISFFAFLSPLPWLLFQGRSPGWRFALGFTLSVVVCGLLSALLPIFDVWLLSHGKLTFGLPNLGKLIQLYLSLVGPAMMLVGGLIAARGSADEHNAFAQAETLVAKTRLLQSQIHPHVLFNALNGLAELIHKDPDAAERAVQHLADLLRRILRASELATLPLGEERRLVTDYLALEAMRLGVRLRVSWDWEDALDGLAVPPLLLQPLVENAIKHGIAPSVAGGDLVVRARASGQDLALEVWNTGQPFQPRATPSGIGIANLRSRLHLTYGTYAALEIMERDGGTSARIRLAKVLK
jgi:LytS/YehU family sensor histidine kinase